MGLTNEELEILEQMEKRGPLPTAPNPKAKPAAPKASGAAPPPVGHERNKIVKQVMFSFCIKKDGSKNIIH